MWITTLNKHLFIYITVQTGGKHYNVKLFRYITTIITILHFSFNHPLNRMNSLLFLSRPIFIICNFEPDIHRISNNSFRLCEITIFPHCFNGIYLKESFGLYTILACYTPLSSCQLLKMA